MNNEVRDVNFTNEEITNINEDNQNKHNNNKNKIIFIIIGIVASLIVIGIVAFFVFIFFYFTAPKYIDKKVSEFTSFVDEMFNNNTLNEDVLLSGSLELDSDIEGFNYFNDLKLNYDLNYSIPKDIIDLNISLNRDNNEFKANMYYNNATLYLDAKDIYPNTLYTVLEDNILSTSDINIDDVKYVINNLVFYFKEALKASDVKTSIRGMSARFSYEINDNNKETFVNKLNKYIKDDGRMLNLLGDLEFTTADFANMVFVVELKIPSGELTSFSLTTTDLVINYVEVLDNVYNLSINNELILEVRTNKDNVNIISKMSDVNYDITYNTKDKTIKGELNYENTTFKIDINNDGNNKNINISYRLIGNYGDPSYNIEFIATIIDNKKIDGNLKITTDNGYLNTIFSLSKVDGTINNKVFDNSVDINTLTSIEQEEISSNIRELVYTFIPDASVSSEAHNFASEASEIINRAALYMTSDSSCVTLEELYNAGIIDNNYTGRITRVSDNSFSITITDSEYMLVNVEVTRGENIAASLVRGFESTEFISAGYTCGN